MKVKHPYQNLESLPLWKVVEKGFIDLKRNGDLEETTASPYIVGYLVQELLASGLIVEPPGRSKKPPPRKTVSKIVMLRLFRKRMRAK